MMPPCIYTKDLNISHGDGITEKGSPLFIWSDAFHNEGHSISFTFEASNFWLKSD